MRTNHGGGGPPGFDSAESRIISTWTGGWWRDVASGPPQVLGRTRFASGGFKVLTKKPSVVRSFHWKGNQASKNHGVESVSFTSNTVIGKVVYSIVQGNTTTYLLYVSCSRHYTTSS